MRERNDNNGRALAHPTSPNARRAPRAIQADGDRAPAKPRQLIQHYCPRPRHPSRALAGRRKLVVKLNHVMVAPEHTCARLGAAAHAKIAHRQYRLPVGNDE